MSFIPLSFLFKIPIKSLFFTSPLAMTSFFLLSSLISMALFADYLAPYAVAAQFPPFSPVSTTHLLGTDDVGHDIFSQLIQGSRISLLVGLSAAFISVVVGVLIGSLAGYCRNWLGESLRGLIDIILLIPFLPLLVMLAAYLGPSLNNIILVISLLGWCSTARVTQARVLQLKSMPFVESLKALGFSSKRILFYHILPNTKEIILAKFILTIAQMMLMEASLSFLGLGDPTKSSWGGMLFYAFHRGGFINGLWQWYLPPGLCIAFATLGFMLLAFSWEKKISAMQLSRKRED